MVNFNPKLHLTSASVNRTFAANDLFSILIESRPSSSAGFDCGTLEENFEEKNMDDKQAPQQPPPGQVQIKADEKELQGMYSNLVMIQHHAEEFTLNFVYVFPNATQGKLLSSMIVSPGHAKRIWRALGENISRFETLYGPIKEGPEGTPGANIGFVQ
jgi:hypothetical protein